MTTAEIAKLPWEQQKAHYAANPLPIPTRGPGITRFIVHLLEKANPKRGGKPLTKEEIVAKLVAKFPERGVDQLRTTIHNNVPTQLTLYYACPVARVANEKAGVSAYYAPTSYTLGEKPAGKGKGKGGKKAGKSAAKRKKRAAA